MYGKITQQGGRAYPSRREVDIARLMSAHEIAAVFAAVGAAKALPEDRGASRTKWRAVRRAHRWVEAVYAAHPALRTAVGFMP